MDKKRILIILVIFLVIIALSFLIFKPRKTSTLTIVTEPKDAVIYIDDSKKDSKFTEFKLNPGQHNVLVEKEGFTSEEDTIDLKPGEKKEIKFVLDPYISSFLPENNDNFMVEEVEENDKKIFKVTLYGIFNRPEQLEEYKKELREHQIEAKEWLKEKGVDPEGKNIQWVPEEKYFK